MRLDSVPPKTIKLEGKVMSNDELVDDLIGKAGGVGRFHFVFYMAIGPGINSIIAWLYYQIPFYI